MDKTTLQPGEILFDKYRIEAFIGRGSCAEVYRVTHQAFNRVRALKILDPDTPGLSKREFQEHRERFHLEAILSAQLNDPEDPNPHLLQVYDHDEKVDRPYLEMEYAPGGSLAGRIQAAARDGEPIPVAEAVEMAIDVARGLSALHERKIVHRDLKPGNILFNQKGRAKVADLGLAQTPDEFYEREKQSVPPKHPGAHAYMSPEQDAKGAGLTSASDVYALGLVLFETLTGLMYSVQPKGTRVTSLWKDAPRWLEDLLARMLAEQPRERPGDGAEVAALLREGMAREEAKCKEEAARREAEERVRREEQARLQRAAEEKERREVEERARQEAEAKARREVEEQARREADERARRADEQHAAVIARLQREAETALARKDWNQAKRLIAQLENLGSDGQAVASHLRKRLPKFWEQIPAWAWAVGGILVIMGVILGVVLSGGGPPSTSTPQLETPMTSTLDIGSTWVRPAEGMVMVYVPEGEFTMGGTADQALSECQKFRNLCLRDWFTNEEPSHTVYLDAYWIDQTEVTNAMYALCVSARACNPPSDTKSDTRTSYYGNSQYDHYPVINVSWNDASDYCSWADTRLPSEAEWEKAARGTNERTYPWGNSFNGDIVNFCDKNCSIDWANKNYDDGYADTAPVGSYLSGASSYNVLDMAGNVLEWVADWYDSSYYANSPFNNPQGPASGKYRVLRGGSWHSYGHGVRSAFRAMESPNSTIYIVGFRCSRSH